MFLASVLGALVALSPLPREQKVNAGWRFWRNENPGVRSTVTLPHTPVLQSETTDGPSWQGIATYERRFVPQPGMAGKRVVLRFEGVMQKATAWVNGERRIVHTGGYLPFELDLSAELGQGKSARVRIEADNLDHPEFPPGRAQTQLDFTYAGGIYRNVWLQVTAPHRIVDVFATGTRVEADRAELRVQVQSVATPTDRLKVWVRDPKGRVVGSWQGPAKPVTETRFEIPKPMRWDFDHPNLYRVEAKLIRDGEDVDRVAVRTGLRKIEFSLAEGMRLNGRRVHPQGTNRHMAFPVVGNAASDAAQYREAALLKSMGMEVLRLAHYPQSPAFLDACDELGILVIDPIPGWQFFRNTDEFRNHVFQDIRTGPARSKPSVGGDLRGLP